MDQESKKPSKADRTRAAILAAAQKLFAGQGYELTTVRDIATIAEIDPALVIRYFGSKDELFARAAVFNLKLPDLSKADRSTVGEMLVRHFLSLWEGENANGGLTVLCRRQPQQFAADKLREIFATQVLPAIAKIGGQQGAAERAGLIASSCSGLPSAAMS